MEVSREFLMSIYKEIRAGDGLEVVRRLREMLGIKKDVVKIERRKDEKDEEHPPAVNL